MTLLLIFVPLFLILLINLPFLKLMNAMALPLAILVCLTQIAIVIFPSPILWNVNIDLFNVFKTVNLKADSLSMVLLLTSALVSLVTLLTAHGTMGNDTVNNKFNFINLILAGLVGMNGIVLVQDLFSIYVFLEITAVASFILIASQRDKAGLEGSFKYLILSAVATAFMLSAIGVFLLVSGSTSFTDIKNALGSSNSFYLKAASAVFIVGLLIKGGVIPFHGWVPDAYSSAPAPVSVYLAGIVTKACGIYVLIRVMTSVIPLTIQIKNIFLLTGTASIVLGALLALRQNDFKRMLAYSSISQVGYIVLSLASGTALGIAGAVFHFFNHAIFKSQLYINSAAVEQQTGTRDMDKLGGLAEKMPWTGFTSVVAFLSTAGIPPLSGFWSKLVIIIALWVAGLKVFAMIAILASLITLAYFLLMQRRVFFGKVREGLENIKEAKFAIVFSAVILALITIGVGVFFPFVLNTFILPVQKIF